MNSFTEGNKVSLTQWKGFHKDCKCHYKRQISGTVHGTDRRWGITSVIMTFMIYTVSDTIRIFFFPEKNTHKPNWVSNKSQLKTIICKKKKWPNIGHNQTNNMFRTEMNLSHLKDIVKPKLRHTQARNKLTQHNTDDQKWSNSFHHSEAGSVSTWNK